MESSSKQQKVLSDVEKLQLDKQPESLIKLSKILNTMPQRQNREQIGNVISKLFDVAASKMKDDADKEVVESLRKYIAMVEEDLYEPKPRYLDAMFFPNEQNVERLIQYMNKATKSIKICVFTMTNDKLANGVNAAWQRGLSVRIISDDECMSQKGSDVHWLSERGVPVRVDDRPDAHMHNKFMVIDDTHVITGSFNWTVTAGNANQENLLVVDNAYYIERYNNEFEKLWKQFAHMELNCDDDVKVQKKQNEAATTIQREWKNQKQGQANKKKIAEEGPQADWGAFKI